MEEVANLTMTMLLTVNHQAAGTVEGSFTQGNRRSDLRQARSIGQAKTHLPHLLTAIAINLLRVFAWLREVPRATTRTSPFVALMARRPAQYLV